MMLEGSHVVRARTSRRRVVPVTLPDRSATEAEL
jgi:hypothetical protein